jgi:four helix bundle protein
MTDGSAIRSYKDLDVWRVAMDLAVACYRATAAFARDEIYGMTAQVRRASVSIAANIAEGYGREASASFVQFLRIAQGSPKELETHLILVERVELLKTEEVAPLLNQCERVSRMLRNLIRSLNDRSRNIVAES